MAARSYNDAIQLLNTCQSNAATIEAIRQSGGKMNQYAIPEMVEYLRRIGYRAEDLNKLNVVHITGTKGKGSTSAFVDQIVRSKVANSPLPPLDVDNYDEDERPFVGGVGLYTSPHLCAVRERIRINGHPLPERLFAKYFFQVWDRLSNPNTDLVPVPNPQIAEGHFDRIPEKPVYFRFLTLLAFHVYLSLQLRLVTLEVGMGGTYDSTNIVPRPLVTGVTSLGLDHTFMLGDTVEEIAANKGGIFKPNVAALVVAQEGYAKRGERVLQERAEELEASSFEIVPVYPELDQIKLGLHGTHQKINASLAIALCKHIFIPASSTSTPATSTPSTPYPSELPASLQPLLESSISTSSAIPSTWVSALQNTRWPGRCQTVLDPNDKATWFLDGAHTKESLTSCGEWVFTSDLVQQGKRVLIFNCTSGRSAEELLEALLRAGQRVTGKGREEVAAMFDTVIFCTNVTYTDGGFKGDLTSKAIDPNDLSSLSTQHALSKAWKELCPTFPDSQIKVAPSIQDAVAIVRELEPQDQVKVLVAGSLHLVGGVMEVAGLAERALSVA